MSDKRQPAHEHHAHGFGLNVASMMIRRQLDEAMVVRIEQVSERRAKDFDQRMVEQMPSAAPLPTRFDPSSRKRISAALGSPSGPLFATLQPTARTEEPAASTSPGAPNSRQAVALISVDAGVQSDQEEIALHMRDVAIAQMAHTKPEGGRP